MTHVLIDFARWLADGRGWFPLLVDAGLKATALLTGAWLLSLALRRTSAATRHFVWTIALAGSLAMPALLAFVPRLTLPLLPDTTAGSHVSAALAQPIAAPGDPAAAARVPQTPAGAAAADAAAAAPDPATTLRQAWTLLMPGAPVLLTLWGAVALILIGRLFVGHLRVRRLRRQSTERPPWLPLATELSAAAGLARTPAFVEGTADAMPMTWGVWHHVVMLPASARAWPEARQRVVLLHEIAHITRHDCLSQTMAGLVCACYWFNPLSWMAAARLRAERERACDDSVLAAGMDGGDYAEQLLDIARALRPAGLLSWATVSMARRSQLEGRLLAILDPDLPRRAPTRAAAAVAVLTLAVLVPALAAVEAGTRRETVAPPIGSPAQGVAGAGEPAAPGAPGTGTDVGALVDAALDHAAAGQRPTPTPTPMPSPTPTPSPMPNPNPNPNPNWNVSGTWSGTWNRNTGWTGGRDDPPQAPVDQKVIDALTAALKDDDAEVREQALLTLGKLRDPRAAAPLIQALTDGSADVREHAAFALGQTRVPAAVDPLIAALKDQAPSVREQAVFALGQIRDTRAVEPVMALVADASADVREQAVFALSQMRDRRATPVLAAALKDASADVRENAAFALGQIRDPAATEALVGLLKDPKPDVREGAVFALGQIRDRRAADALVLALQDSSPDVQQGAAYALGQLRDPKAVDGLIAAMRSPSADVRQSAAYALGQIGDSRATDALMAALKDADADVRQAAAQALSQVIGRDGGRDEGRK